MLKADKLSAEGLVCTSLEIGLQNGNGYAINTRQTQRFSSLPQTKKHLLTIHRNWLGNKEWFELKDLKNKERFGFSGESAPAQCFFVHF